MRVHRVNVPAAHAGRHPFAVVERAEAMSLPIPMG